MIANLEQNYVTKIHQDNITSATISKLAEKQEENASIKIKPNIIISGYKRCLKCGANIALTPHNTEGKCPYESCSNFGFIAERMDLIKQIHQNSDNQTLLDTLYSKIESAENIVGKQAYTSDLGDNLICISEVYLDTILAITTKFQSSYVLTVEEFNSIQTESNRE